MFARLFTWLILLPLLLGAIAVAPAAASDHHRLMVVEASSPVIDHVPPADRGDGFDRGDLVNDITPLMAAAEAASLPPKWLATWARDRAKAIAHILLVLPDEPPRRMA